MAHLNEMVVRRFLEAVPQGDMGTVEELFADDIVWHWAGRGRLSGEYRGKDQVLEFFGRFGRMLAEGGVEHNVELHDVVPATSTRPCCGPGPPVGVKRGWSPMGSAYTTSTMGGSPRCG